MICRTGNHPPIRYLFVDITMNSLRIGLVGYGMIGKVHALAYREVPHYFPDALPPIELAAICTTRMETAQKAAREAGFGAALADVNALVQRDDVNVVDCCAPNFQHREIILAAINAGKHIIVDKPLALNHAEAKEIADAAERAGVSIGIVFNYRFVPALMRAKQLIDEGFLGEIYHYHIEYLHTGYQNPNRAMSWRLRRAQSGGGALVDLGSHVIDLARFLVGDFVQVLATTRTYITDRPSAANSSEREQVDVDDAAWLQAKMENGASGTLMVTRFATGASDDLNLEIYGQRGALRFSLANANWLAVYDPSASDEPLGGKRGWTRVETFSRYPGAVVPPSRGILGWNRTHAQNIFALLDAFAKNQAPSPGVMDGVKVHQVIDAAYESAANGAWVMVEPG